MDFQQALEAHLDAITRRDLDAFAATLARSDELTVILPNGTRFKGYDRVIDMHSAWFADPDWRMEAELLHTVERDAMALAVLLVTYDDLDQQGQPYQLRYYLSLVFTQAGADWLLIHDQNTPIAA